MRQRGGEFCGGFGVLFGFEPLSGVDFGDLSGGEQLRQPGGAGEGAGVRVVGQAGGEFGRGCGGGEGGGLFAAGNQNHGQGEPLYFFVGFGLQYVVERGHHGAVCGLARGHAEGDGKVEVEILRQHAVNLRAQCFCGQFALCAAARGLFGVHQQFAFDGFGGVGAGVGEIAVF